MDKAAKIKELLTLKESNAITPQQYDILVQEVIDSKAAPQGRSAEYGSYGEMVQDSAFGSYFALPREQAKNPLTEEINRRLNRCFLPIKMDPVKLVKSA